MIFVFIRALFASVQRNCITKPQGAIAPLTVHSFAERRNTGLPAGCIAAVLFLITRRNMTKTPESAYSMFIADSGVVASGNKNAVSSGAFRVDLIVSFLNGYNINGLALW